MLGKSMGEWGLCGKIEQIGIDQKAEWQEGQAKALKMERWELLKLEEERWNGEERDKCGAKYLNGVYQGQGEHF